MISLCHDSCRALALEYGLPAPAAGVAHPVRTRKRASPPAAGLEPAARRLKTQMPKEAETGAFNPDDDVAYVGEPISQSSPALTILPSLSLKANILQQCS